MDEHTQLEQAIVALEAQRALLGDAVVDAALGPMRDRLASLVPERQRKHATILFADVAGFTSMGNTMDAEAVSDTMNALWHEVDAAILQHGGMIDKHMGDGIMAIWGAQTAREDDPGRAVRAALAMQDALDTFCRTQAVTLRMRIGINTGPVLVGTVGTTNELTAMGDTVNLASRLEHAAPVGGILIAHTTYQHVRDHFVVQILDPIMVKGKPTPIPVYRIDGVMRRSSILETRVSETPMVGRDVDLRCLQDAVRALVTTGTPQVITVLGDAGLGKTRLLMEWRQWLNSIPDRLDCLVGRATPESEHQPYALLREILASRFAIQESDSASAARGKFVAGVIDTLDGPPSDAQLTAQFIGQLLGFDFAASPQIASVLDDPHHLHQSAVLGLTALWTALSQRVPLVIAVEDLHWADDASLDLLAALINPGVAVPMLLVACARPRLLDRRPTWGEDQAAHTRLSLQPLSTADSRRLVAALLPDGPAVGETVGSFLAARADGNPFYLEELITMLRDHHLLVADHAEWRHADERVLQSQVPSTLTGVLQARLDRLPRDERIILQQASIIGRVFWDQAVQAMRDPDNDAAPSLLAAVLQRGLIHQHPTSSFGMAIEYLFRHALLRDVAYETVLMPQRRHYHTRVADWLITASGDQVEASAALIADHYHLAAYTADAAQWYMRAGQYAQATYANDAALAAYTRARESLPTGAQAEVLLAMGTVHETVGQWDAAAACYHTALDESTGNLLMQARVQRASGQLGSRVTFRKPCGG